MPSSHPCIADMGAKRVAASHRRPPWDPSAWLVAPWCGSTACSVWTMGESPVTRSEEACEEGSYHHNYALLTPLLQPCV